MTFGARRLSTVDKKMSTDHLRIAVPTLEVFDHLASLSREGERGCVFIYNGLFCNCKLLILDSFLALDDADNQSSYDVKGWLGMVMRSSDRLVDQVVPTKEKL